MVFIVTALMIEAAPIIEYFKLKKDMNVHTYPVYKNSDIALIVSGVGKIKSSMAAVYLLSIYDATKKDILLNIGFCGASNTKYNLGSLLLIHKITDMDTGRDYYPDVFLDNNLPREAILCYSKPVSQEIINRDISIFCDMESSGIMEVAKKFIYAHQVTILKIISDYLTPTNLNKDTLQDYIRDNMFHVDQIIHELKQLNVNYTNFSLAEERNLLNIVSDNLRFSESMKHILLKEIKKSKLKGYEPLKTLKFLIGTKVNSKVEGKKIFEQVIGKLKQNSI